MARGRPGRRGHWRVLGTASRDPSWPSLAGARLISTAFWSELASGVCVLVKQEVEGGVTLRIDEARTRGRDFEIDAQTKQTREGSFAPRPAEKIGQHTDLGQPFGVVREIAMAPCIAAHGVVALDEFCAISHGPRGPICAAPGAATHAGLLSPSSSVQRAMRWIACCPDSRLLLELASPTGASVGAPCRVGLRTWSLAIDHPPATVPQAKAQLCPPLPDSWHGLSLETVQQQVRMRPSSPRGGECAWCAVARQRATLRKRRSRCADGP